MLKHLKFRSGEGILALFVVAMMLLFVAEPANADLTAPTSVVTNTMSSWGIVVNGDSEVDVNDNVDLNRVDALLQIATNGITVNDRWDTFCWDTAPVTDFAGLYYGTSSQFDTIDVTVHLFGDGGDWEAQPKLYILMANYDTGGARPEFHPLWQEVTGFTETTGHVFNPASAGGGIEQTFSYDLTSIPEVYRTGYGWAVGGVNGTSHPDDPNAGNFIAIAELSATGNTGAPDPVIPNPPELVPINVFSNIYNATRISRISHWFNNRGAAFEVATNGVIATQTDEEFMDQWDTFPVGEEPTDSDFAGLYYGRLSQFDSVTAHTITSVYIDGGEWAEEPKLYILKNNVDTNQLRPELSSDWMEVTGAVFSSTTAPDPLSVRQANAFSFDLSGLPLADRVGYGWAIGGVDGTANDVGSWHFITVTELEATGMAIPEPTSVLLLGLGLLALAGLIRRR